PARPRRSCLAVPLEWRGRVFGVLEMDSSEADAFGETDLGLMRRVGASLGGLIELARRYATEVQSAAAAATAERLKDELLSVVSHEFRTPLASLIGFSELLMTREFDEPRQRQFLTIMLAEGRRLAALIDDLLDVQRLESGRQPIVAQTADLASILRFAATAAGDAPGHP